MDENLTANARPEISLRLLREDDIAFADELRALAGWNQSVSDWRGFVAYEPEGCFVAEVDGRRAGTATTIRYEDRFGWIGMVLVHPDRRRLGIGSRLLRHAIEHLQRQGVRSIKLDATPMGRAVYLPLGFVDEYGLARYEGVAPDRSAGAADGVGPVQEADWPGILKLDATAFGAERARVLRALAGRHPELAWVARRGGAVTGFLCAREGARTVQVGPWVAQDATTAADLLRVLFARVAGRRVFIDVIDPNPAAVALVAGHGFTVQRTLTRMYRGENTHPGAPRLVFGISSPEKG